MKIIQLPFFLLKMRGQSEKFLAFFNGHLFSDKSNTKSLFSITIECQHVIWPKHRIQLEDDVCRDDTHFYFKDTKGRVAQLDFHSLTEKSWKIFVDPDFDPYLLYTFVIESVAIIALATQGVIFFHASAVVDKYGKAILFPAWQHTGKTHLILQLTQAGFFFAGDDYCVVKGSELFVYPKNVNLFSYNFKEFPQLEKHLDFGTQLRIALSLKIKKTLVIFSHFFGSALGKVFFRLSELAEISTNIRMKPTDLLMNVANTSTLESIFLIQRGNGDMKKNQFHIEQFVDLLENIMVYEQREFLHLYKKYLFLFSDKKKNPVIESFSKNYKSHTKKIVSKVDQYSIITNLDTLTSNLIKSE